MILQNQRLNDIRMPWLVDTPFARRIGPTPGKVIQAIRNRRCRTRALAAEADAVAVMNLRGSAYRGGGFRG